MEALELAQALQLNTNMVTKVQMEPEQECTVHNTSVGGGPSHMAVQDTHGRKSSTSSPTSLLLSIPHR